jgi:hypothetical protein
VGGSWVDRNILKQHPEADLAVYTVWVPALAGDSEDEIDGGLLADPRAERFWDPDTTVPEWLALNLLDGSGPSGLLYDLWLLFGTGARWEEDSLTGLEGDGQTVIGTTDELADRLRPVLEG